MVQDGSPDVPAGVHADADRDTDVHDGLRRDNRRRGESKPALFRSKTKATHDLLILTLCLFL